MEIELTNIAEAIEAANSSDDPSAEIQLQRVNLSGNDILTQVAAVLHKSEDPFSLVNRQATEQMRSAILACNSEHLSPVSKAFMLA